MVVSGVEEWVISIWARSPIHLIVELILVIIILIFLCKPEPVDDPSNSLTESEQNSLIAERRPEPFVPEEDMKIDESIFNTHVVTSGPSDTIEVDGKRMMNFGTPNFFGLSMNQEIIEEAVSAVDYYAVGTCGPRQPYGTFDIHLQLEAATAKWLGTEDSVNYCHPFATTSSVIQALVHSTDIMFIDECAWFAINFGAELANVKVITFKHNDLNDLRAKVTAARIVFNRWKKCNRWVVVEGLYACDGTIVDLQSLVQLRSEFCLRLIIDETYSFGALGKTGKGVCELYDVSRDMVEASIGSYVPSLGSFGGFTIGSSDISSHQRLASHAYIFSSSTPPFHVKAALKAIEIVEKDGEERCKKLRDNVELARNELKDIKGLELISDELSPVLHFRLRRVQSIHEEDVILQKFCDECMDDQNNPLAIVKSKSVRIEDDSCVSQRPTIRFFVSPAHNENQIHEAASTMKQIAIAMFK